LKNPRSIRPLPNVTAERTASCSSYHLKGKKNTRW